MIDVCCILINYNTHSYTLAAVNSILDLHDTSQKLEIIVVDNCSELEDFRKLKNEISTFDPAVIKLIRSNINTGFSGGNMLGVINSSPTKYYAFINNDTLQVDKNCLWKLKDFMQNYPDAGICSPQMLDQHKNFRVTIDHFSSLQREILRRPLLEKLFPKTYLNRKKTYTKPTKVNYVQGSFIFIDAEDFNALGGFDTNIFLYYEESDLGLRLLKQKKKYTYLVPNLNYIHFKSASTKKNISVKKEQKLSLLYHTRKHYGLIQHHILLSYLILRYFFTSIFKPKYWPLLKLLIIGAPLHKSLKQQQKINL